MRKPFAIVASLTMSLSVSSIHAQGQAKELYVGLEGIRSELNKYDEDASPDEVIDNEDDSLKFIMGYQLSPRVAAELTYIDKVSFSRNAVDSFGTVDATINMSAFAFNVVANVPMGKQFDAFGKVGFGLWKIEGTAVSTFGPSTVTDYLYDNGNGLSYGAGLHYKMSDSLKLRGEYDVMEVIADLELRTYSVGIMWQF